MINTREIRNPLLLQRKLDICGNYLVPVRFVWYERAPVEPHWDCSKIMKDSHLPRPRNHCCSCCCSSLVSKLASTAPRELHKCAACDWSEGVSSITWYVELGQNSAWKRIRRMKHSMFAVWEQVPSFRYYHLNMADNENGEYQSMISSRNVRQYSMWLVW